MYIDFLISGFYEKDKVAETSNIASSVKGNYKPDDHSLGIYKFVLNHYNIFCDNVVLVPININSKKNCTL
jgi:hypothetical protein